MKIHENTPVGQIAAKHPLATRVFARHAIDFCCGGGKPIAEVCRRKGLDTQAVLDEIEDELSGAGGDPKRWDEAELHDLIDHILVTYHRPLAEELHQRITMFGQAFGQIVAAQFWIAAFNTLLTAIFLLVLMPLWGPHLPYTPALITLTFVAGLVPIVGNLVCNAVITLVALSVSPVTAAACLAFLILIHKAEYVINAKVVGSRTQMSVWELLAVMFVAEAVFGPAGLVAAPLFYAYLKKELQAGGLV